MSKQYYSDITGKSYKSDAIRWQAENRAIWYNHFGAMAGYNKERGEELRKHYEDPWGDPWGEPPEEPPPVADFIIPYEVFKDDWHRYEEENKPGTDDPLLAFLIEVDWEPKLSEIVEASKSYSIIMDFFYPIIQREYGLVFWNGDEDDNYDF